MISRALFWTGLAVLLSWHEPYAALGSTYTTALESSTVRQVFAAPQNSVPPRLRLSGALLPLTADFCRRAIQILAEIRENLNGHKHPPMQGNLMRRVNADNLREIMRVAKLLQNYVGETNDPHNAQIFLEASDALMERAHTLAHGDRLKPIVRTPINIVC